MELPGEGPAQPVSSPHFPTAFHAVVFRNWGLVPVDVLARVLNSTIAFVSDVAAAMGLSRVEIDLRSVAYLSIIRRNWHLLSLGQIAALLDWSEERLARALSDDDFLFVKLGSAKPHCGEIREVERNDAIRRREEEIRAVVTPELADVTALPREPLFGFRNEFTFSGENRQRHDGLSPILCYGYFADYADDDAGYPDGYLSALRTRGVDSLWQPGLLRELVPFPWDEKVSAGWEHRLEVLRDRVRQLAASDMRLYVYLNEPRAMPAEFYKRYPDLAGARETDVAALCTSLPEVRAYLTEAVEKLCSAVPDLGGIITITFSENLTNCWSHMKLAVQSGTEADVMDCQRCLERGLPTVVSEVNNAIAAGIRTAGTAAELLAWDWSWPDQYAEDIIDRTDSSLSLLSVSEWGTEITRGGITSVVDEYALSAPGPSDRARRHWDRARRWGMRTLAKIQINNSWEIAAVPYVPVTPLVAAHLKALVNEGVDGIMASWTLGGYPSPSMALLAEAASAGTAFDPDSAVKSIAERVFGTNAAPTVVAAWEKASTAFAGFPFAKSVAYTAPVNVGPANPLWSVTTGYRATMVGFPYDDVERWRGPYPADVLARELRAVSAGLAEASRILSRAGDSERIASERRLLDAVEIHLASAANQVLYVTARDRGDDKQMRRLLSAEEDLARRLIRIQWVDSRVGYEASNHYFYTPLDLVEKIMNCRHLEDQLQRQD